jgi:AraC-like DNA-binding protein
MDNMEKYDALFTQVTNMDRIDTTDDRAYQGARLLANCTDVERESRLAKQFQVRLVGMYHSVIGPEWSSSDGMPQSDYLHHIDINLSGRRQVMHGGQAFDIGPGQVWFLPGNTPVERRCGERCEVVYFKLSCEWLPGVDPLLDWPDRGPRCAGTCSVEEWREWAARGRSYGIMDFLRLRGYLLLWMTQAMPEFEQVVSAHLKSSVQFTEVFNVLEEQLGADLRMATLAQAYGTTVGAFAIAFSRSMGISPKEYLTRRINQQALYWVCNTDLKMKGIAEKLRFADEFYFSRFFKKLNGCPPSAYRQRYQR